MNQTTHFTIVSGPATARRWTLRVMYVALAIVTSGTFLPGDNRASGQTPQGTARPAARTKHRLRVTKGYITVVSLKADETKFSDIAADLSKRLGPQVILGPGLRTKRITVEFYDLPLESALGLLGSRVYIDYEIRANALPKPLAIYLMDQDDPDPPKNAVVQGSSEAMMFEGNTEDVEEPAVADADEPLLVEMEDDQLTIRSKKQLLVAVLLTIAGVMEIPAEIKYDSTEIIDTVIKETNFEDAITRLSPNIRLYVRADLTRSQRMPLRLKLVPPEKVDDSAMSQ